MDLKDYDQRNVITRRKIICFKEGKMVNFLV